MTTPAPTSGPLLLLVDDAADMGLIVRRLGRRAGWEVAVCPDGPSALGQLEGRPVDLLLLDLNLPGVSGVEVCRRLRATPALAPLPVALFSHWHLADDLVAGLDAGADFIVCKDLVGQPEAWQRRVEEILSRTDGRARPWFLRWQEGERRPRVFTNWADVLSQSLRQLAGRINGGEVLQWALRRSVHQAWGSRFDVPTLASWLTGDGLGIDPRRLPSTVGARSVCVLIAVLAERLWCLLGTEASAAWRQALAAAVPALAELLSRP
jgi:DNA-binding response OmpR family regulator